MRVEEEEREVSPFLARVALILAQIQEDSHGKRGVIGVFPCPCCNVGTVSWAVSAYNGHRRAQCSSPSCVDFME